MVNIMIVEDDPLISRLHKHWVVKAGLHPDPVIAFNGKEALELLSGDHQDTECFLLFLDINMPVMDGWTLLKELGQRSLPFPVYAVMVTSSCNQADKERAEKEELVIGYLEKPLTPEVLKQFSNMERFI